MLKICHILSYILIYNFKPEIPLLSHNKNKYYIYLTFINISIYFTSLSNFKINQLHIQKNRQVILKNKVYAQYLQPLDYYSNIITHTHHIFVNWAPT